MVNSVKIIAYCNLRNYRKFAIEANQFQELIAQEVERRSAEKNLNIPIERITNDSDKLKRIQSLEPKINTGYLQFSKKHKLLLEQLRFFPKCPHDDGPDALQMAIRSPEVSNNKITWLAMDEEDEYWNKECPIQDPNERNYGRNYDDTDDGGDDD